MFFWVQKIKSSSTSVDIMKLIIFGMSKTKDSKKTEWVYCDFFKGETFFKYNFIWANFLNEWLKVE